MALSLLCGGLGVASATDVVHVDESTPGTAEVYTKAGVDALLDDYGKKEDVQNNKNNIANLQTTTIDQGKKITENTTNIANNKADIAKKIDNETANERFATKDALRDLKDTVDDKANTDLSNLTAAGETKIKETMSADMEKKANKDTVTALVGRVGGLETTIGTKANQNDLLAATNRITANEGNITELQRRTTNIDFDVANQTTSINGMKVGQQVDMGGKDITNAGALTATGKVTGDGVDAGDGAITTTGAVNAGSLKVTGEISNGNGVTTTLEKINASMEKTNQNADKVADLEKKTSKIAYDAANDKTTINGVGISNTQVDMGGKDITNAGALTATGKVTGDGVDAGDGAITTKGAVNAGSLIVENASNLKGNVTMDKKLSVTGDTSLKKTDVDGALTVTDASDLKGNVILGTNATNTVTVNGTANFIAPVNMDKGLTVTNGETKLKNTTVEGNLNVTGTITTDKMVFGDPATGNYTEINKGNITSKNAAVAGDATLKSSSMELDHTKLEVGVADKDSKGHLTMTADQTSIKNSDLAGKNYSEIVADKDSVRTTVKDEKDNTTSTKSSATEIRNYASDAAGNKTINVQTATQNKSWAKDKDGNESSIVQTGKDITNTAQNGTITNDAQTIVNNASGDMMNTVGGKLTTTVTGQATEDFNGGLDTNVTGTENHTVTGDQDITVSGTQTTTATDIKRNASSGMIDTIDNDYGTNTETKVAGKTTTDVSIKGTEEKGQYIRGANESRDYLIKGTLKNSETKTAEATSTEITDGKGKTSATIQDVNNLAGSVTNGTETGVSGIHANDNSVSIDSIVTDGNKYSVINQKKGSIQSTVVDGTNSTVILQDKDNVTIASSNGTVAIGGKDIVSNAQDTITNTAGTKITDTAGDSSVVTEKGKGTTFTKTGSTAYSTEADAPTDTNIAGNLITTGRVDANELKVSDKDDHGNTADFSVEAGEGVKASASNGTTTGSLDVKADEVGSSVKDASGKGSTFKQRIDAIMMESKNVSITAEEKLTNEAKDIVTNASNSITEKVGETNVTKKTTTSSISEIQNADTITSVQQTEKMVQSYVGKKDGSATNVTTNFANASANQVTENGQTSTVLNNKDGLLIRNTANGSSFTTADGTNTGTASGWTNVKGNEISTGKVEANYVKMDYADVMRDLGVRGNANINGKTTTGSLEVKGESKLTGDVTMESNATVKKDLNVEGTTTTKTLKVTENATVGGTLDVAKKATFQDSVDIAKDLSVGGDVTAKSYKVGDKTYISAAGINANDQKITNVADGSISEGSKDAVNGGQLYGMKTDLEHKVDKVGANAAAMANLHPMEFDPDSKWNIAAAMGNYGSETATAIGAFYRPNEDVMVNFSTAFGTGENMVGGGVSVRLGKGSNKLSRQESNALKAQVNDLTARMDALLSVLNPNMSKDFPDVPENHWAYEAVSRLAGNDIVQGYPDGEFHGDRTMTRYEMAEIIYNALSRGAEAERELVEEFKPELQAMAASEKATAERAEG